MSSTNGPRPVPDTVTMNAADALDLIAVVLAGHTRRASSRAGGGRGLPYTSDDCLVGCVLREAGVAQSVLEVLDGLSIRELWRERGLPLPMTFGAVLVLHRAQAVADRGLPWSAAYRESWAAAVRLVRLVAGDQAAGDQPILAALQRIEDSLAASPTRPCCRPDVVRRRRLPSSPPG